MPEPMKKILSFKVVNGISGIKSISLSKNNSPKSNGNIEKQLIEYLDGKRRIFKVKLDLKGTPFQQKVWEALQEIPYGQTATYKDIAVKIGRPKAVRAVSNAVGANPIAIIIPCHRVICSNGSLGGYRWGARNKLKLLKLEALTSNDLTSKKAKITKDTNRAELNK